MSSQDIKNINFENNETLAWLTLIFLSAIWGTSFILIKKALIVFEPSEVALLRIGISGLAFTPFFIIHFRKLEWHRWPIYIVIALTGSAVPAFLFATAQTQISSSTAGILNSMTPIFTLIIGTLAFKNATNKFQIIGIFLGFVGAVLLITLGGGGGKFQITDLIYGGLIIIGALLYGTNVNLIQKYFSHVNSIRLSTFAFFMLGIPVLLFIPFTEIPHKVLNDPLGWQSLGYMTILAVVSTMLALIIFYKLVQQTDAVFGSSVAYLIPIVAMIWGFADGELISIFHIISMALIIFGVYLSRIKPKVNSDSSSGQ